MDKTIPNIFVISDSTQTDNLLNTLKICIDSGIQWVGIREYTYTEYQVCTLLEELLHFSHKYTCQFSIFNNPAIAQKYTIGLHLSTQRYTDVYTHKKETPIPNIPLLGTSTHTTKEITAIKHMDYITASPLFDSTSKSLYAGIGIKKFTEMIQNAPCPVYALGGITPDTLPIALEKNIRKFALCGFAMHNADKIHTLIKTLQ